MLSPVITLVMQRWSPSTDPQQQSEEEKKKNTEKQTPQNDLSPFTPSLEKVSILDLYVLSFLKIYHKNLRLPVM